MKKTLLILSLLIALALAACTPKTSPEAPSADPSETADVSTETTPGTDPATLDPEPHGGGSIVTDFVPGEVEVHEVILPWEADEGEELASPYHIRTVNDEGEYVYAVLKASNHQVSYLPVGQTVVYTSEDGECYYEKSTNTYKLDGAETSEEQYQLHIATKTPSKDNDSLKKTDTIDTDNNNSSSTDPVSVSSNNAVDDIVGS